MRQKEVGSEYELDQDERTWDDNGCWKGCRMNDIGDNW